MAVWLMSPATYACYSFTFYFHVLICVFSSFFLVTNTFKKTGDTVTSKAPAVDLDHKFRCKVVDCLKFFRKAKLLHYHMKYFHGMEKSPEPEESLGKRHVQTRGSSASDRTSQESLTRKRVSASSPSKYFHSELYLYHGALCCSSLSGYISNIESRCWCGPSESQKIENDKWSSWTALWGKQKYLTHSYLSLLLFKLPWESHLAFEGFWYSQYEVGTIKGRELLPEPAGELVLRTAWLQSSHPPSLPAIQRNKRTKRWYVFFLYGPNLSLILWELQLKMFLYSIVYFCIDTTLV